MQFCNYAVTNWIHLYHSISGRELTVAISNRNVVPVCPYIKYTQRPHIYDMLYHRLKIQFAANISEIREPYVMMIPGTGAGTPVYHLRISQMTWRFSSNRNGLFVFRFKRKITESASKRKQGKPKKHVSIRRSPPNHLRHLGS